MIPKILRTLLVQLIPSYKEAYLGSCQTCITQLSRENTQQLLVENIYLTIFHRDGYFLLLLKELLVVYAIYIMLMYSIYKGLYYK